MSRGQDTVQSAATPELLPKTNIPMITHNSRHRKPVSPVLRELPPDPLLVRIELQED